MPSARLASLAAVLCTAAAARAEAPRLAVMPLVANRIDKETVVILDELTVNAVASRGTLRVISASDINAILGLDRMKQALSCDDVACAADIGGALGAQYLLAGSVSRLGDELIVSLKLVDIARQEVVSRAEQTCRNDEGLYRGAITAAVAQVLGEPVAAAPPPRADPEPARPAAAVLPPAPERQGGSEPFAAGAASAYVNVLGLIEFGLSPTLEFGQAWAWSLRGMWFNSGLLSYAQADGDDLNFSWAAGPGLRRYYGAGGNLRGVYLGGTAMYMHWSQQTGDSQRYESRYLAAVGEAGYRWVYEDGMTVGVGVSAGYLVLFEKKWAELDGFDGTYYENDAASMPFGYAVIDIGYLM